MLILTKEAVEWFFSQSKYSFKNPEKAKIICELRLSGLTYEKIGEKVSLSTERTRAYVERVQKTYERNQRLVKYGSQK